MIYLNNLFKKASPFFLTWRRTLLHGVRWGISVQSSEMKLERWSWLHAHREIPQPSGFKEVLCPATLNINLVAAGRLSDRDSWNQWQMCGPSPAMDPPAVCTCCLQRPRWRCECKDSKGQSTAKLRKSFFPHSWSLFLSFLHLKGQDADGITHDLLQPIILRQ